MRVVVSPGCIAFLVLVTSCHAPGDGSRVVRTIARADSVRVSFAYEDPTIVSFQPSRESRAMLAQLRLRPGPPCRCLHREQVAFGTRGPIVASMCEHCFAVRLASGEHGTVRLFEMPAELRGYLLGYRDSTRLRQPRTAPSW